MSTTNNCSNDFYSNIINYGSTNRPNNNSLQLNNMGRIVAPYPATVRPQLFMNNPKPHAYTVNMPQTHTHQMKNCDGYRVLEELCIYKT